MRILLVVGSLRERSFNRQLANAIVDEVGERAEVVELDYARLPLMNQDIEWPTPPEVQCVRDEFGASDAVWFVCPEYNGYFPGAVKNLIDWMSRPTVAGDFSSPTAIGGKPVTVSGAAGRSGSRRMQQQLADLLEAVRARVLREPTVGVVIPAESWASNVLVLSPEDRTAITEQVDAFLSFVS